MRLAVIGNKEFRNYEFLKVKLQKEKKIAIIISGGAPGVDAFAKKFAKEKGIHFLEFPPDFERDGGLAKLKRNRKIVENCDKLIAFWDGKCGSTKYTLDYARKFGIETEIIPLKIL